MANPGEPVMAAAADLGLIENGTPDDFPPKWYHQKLGGALKASRTRPAVGKSRISLTAASSLYFHILALPAW